MLLLQFSLLLYVVAARYKDALVVVAGEIVADVGAALEPAIPRGLLGIERHVGRQDHVVPIGQGMGVQVGVLVGEHVQIGVGDLTAVDGVDHLLLYHHAAAGGVDEHQVVGDLVKQLLADEVLRALDQRHVEADVVGLTEQGLHIHHGDAVLVADRLVNIGVCRQNAHTEAGQVLGHQTGDLAEARQTNGLRVEAVNVGAYGVVPLFVPPHTAVVGEQPLVVGQDAGRHVVCHINGEGTAQVGDGDAAGLGGLQIHIKVCYGGHKIFSDGSLGSRSAKLLVPYSDAPDTDGILVQSQQELNEHMLKAYEMGLQPATHCIGDKGLDCVLTAIEYTLEKSREHGMTAREQADRDPFRIIHAQMATDDMIRRMQKLPVVLDLQPVFLETDMHWAVERIGPERAAYSYRWETYRKAGLILTGGSDCPVEPFSPWLNIYTAVARKDFHHCPEGGYQPEEKMSVYDAVCMFTKNLHYAAGQDAVLGTLEPGKFADMVVIDRDIFKIPADEIMDIQVEKTYLAGREVYSK